MVESGIFYGTFIDPLLGRLRTRVTAEIGQGETVIDIACGTGTQAFALAARAAQVTGVDLSLSMIDFANQKLQKLGLKNISFYTADATQLAMFGDKSFDVATMSLALHQFDLLLVTPILSEMKRIAKRVVIVDYAVPLPNNFVGTSCRIAEFLAGGQHNLNFKQFYSLGGLNSILPAHAIAIQKSVFFAKGAFQLVVGTQSR